MAKTVTALTGVKTKNGTSARGPWLLSIFSAADGREYSTFDGALASKANSLLNQTLEVEYSERPNGEYINYTLEGVEAAAGHPTPVVQEEVPLPEPASKNDQFRTKEQIMRTDALNATLNLFSIIGLDPLSSAEEFEGWFFSLYALIENGEFSYPGALVMEEA